MQCVCFLDSSLCIVFLFQIHKINIFYTFEFYQVLEHDLQFVEDTHFDSASTYFKAMLY